MGECANTYILAVLPYLTDVCEAIIDLLQIETVSEVEKRKDVAESEPPPETKNMDDDPTSKNAKFAPLRRATIHLLCLLLRATVRHLYDTSYRAGLLSGAFIHRAKVTVSYVASTDVDTQVRVMANEANDLLKQVERAMIGL
jgi:hypothetical protein